MTAYQELFLQSYTNSSNFMQVKEMSYQFFYKYCISSNKTTVAGGDYFFVQLTKWGDYFREGEYSRQAIISNKALRKLCPKYFDCVIISH